MSELSYYEIALKTYRCLDVLFETAEKMDWYNSFTVECQQIVEKLLKDILMRILPVSTKLNALLSSHDLAVLSRALNKEYPNTIKVADCAWLTDYYFDTRYPGDNFFVVTKADAEDVKEITIALSDKLIEFHNYVVAKPTSYFS